MSTDNTRILLVDWDEDFATALRSELKGIARLEHLISAPELDGALELSPTPVAILVDIDAFRLIEGAPLTKALKRYSWIPRILLTRQRQVSLELDPDLGHVLLARKDESPRTLAQTLDAHIALNQQLGQTEERVPTQTRVESLEGHMLSHRDIFELQRQASIGKLAAGICHELTNINSILIGATDELARTTAEAGTEAEHEDTISDLQWVHQNLKNYADHLLRVSRKPRRVVEMVDLSKLIEQTLAALEALGKTKYIGVESDLCSEAVFVRISRAHIEHILINLISIAADGVLNSQATLRRISIQLIHHAEKERIELRIQDTASREHGAFIQQCLAGEINSSEALDLMVAKRLVDANGGILRATSAEGEGTVLFAEFPTEFAAEVTSPLLYKLDAPEPPQSGNFTRSELERTRLR
jgi:C4-dicarboxylate-specific signal transduction histidine kinase